MFAMSKLTYACLDIRSFYARYEQITRSRNDPTFDNRSPVIVYYFSYPTGNHGRPISDEPNGVVVIATTSESGIERGFYSIDDNILSTVESSVPMTMAKYREYRQESERLYNGLFKWLEKQKWFNEFLPQVHSSWKYVMDDFTMMLEGDQHTITQLIALVEFYYQWQGYEIAAGVSFNESYAKIALSLGKEEHPDPKNKPRYSRKTPLFEIASKVDCFGLPVAKFYNIARVREGLLDEAGIFTVGELFYLSESDFFGILGNTEITRRIRRELKGESSKNPLKGDLEYQLNFLFVSED